MFKIQILHNGEISPGRFSDLKTKHTTVWLDCASPTASEFEQIAEHTEISVEEISELLHKNQRPIIEDIGKFTAVVFHSPEAGRKSNIVKPHLFLASKEQKDFISLHQGSSAALDRIDAYPTRRKLETFQKGSTALLFAALSELATEGFAVLDFFGEEIGRLEEQVFDPKLSQMVMRRVFQIKKELIYLQRSFSSDREVVSEIEKAYGQFLDPKQLSDFRLLHADVTQLIELAATYRDIIISVVEVHLSAISNNLNVIMKKLTAWAAIILVPSLFAGIFGMNFQVLPLSTHPSGFWFMVGLMFVSVIALYLYFKHNDWV
ncbi:MAG: magnesium transporter CorA family protein [bacterium]|nr:magnesium transporter CorA family protein [bacterium]